MDVLSFSTIADYIKKEINHKCGLNLSQTRILLFFDSNHNQPLTMGKLAEGLNISLSTLSRQLQQKKTQELIQVTRSEKDSSKSVHLSSSGLQKVTELKKALTHIEKSLTALLNDNSKSFFAELEFLTSKLQ